MPIETVPAPTWTGIEPGVKETFLAYCAKFTNTQNQAKLDELRRNLQLFTNDRDATLRALKDYRKRLKEIGTQLEAARAALQQPPTDDEAMVLLQRMQQLPGFIGIRCNEFGEAVLAFRMILGEGDVLYDVGDFEINFNVQAGGYYELRDYTFKTLRTPQGYQGRRLLTGDTSLKGIDYSNDLYYENYEEQDTLIRLRKEGKLYEFAETAIGILYRYAVKNKRYLARLTLDDPDPEFRWSGLMQDSHKLLAQTSYRMASKNAIDSVKVLEREQEDYANTIRNRTADVGRYNESIQLTATKIRELEALITTEERLISDAKAEEIFAYIQTLPGFLGMGMQDDVPLIHVRTTGVHKQKRYDFGDFTIKLQVNDPRETRAVVPIECTRSGNLDPQNAYHRYFHPRAGNAQTTFPATGWFCFGYGRGDQLRSMLRRGEISEFLHIALNSMNSYNEEDGAYLYHTYKQIDMADVWTAPQKKGRPRRVPRAVHIARVTGQDVQQPAVPEPWNYVVQVEEQNVEPQQNVLMDRLMNPGERLEFLERVLGPMAVRNARQERLNEEQARREQLAIARQRDERDRAARLALEQDMLRQQDDLLRTRLGIHARNRRPF